MNAFDYLHSVLEHVKFDLTFQKRLTKNRLQVPLTQEEHEYFIFIMDHVAKAQMVVEELRIQFEDLKKKRKRFLGLF